MADPYLEGDLAPVRTDHTAVDLAVTGTTPEGADALCEGHCCVDGKWARSTCYRGTFRWPR